MTLTVDLLVLGQRQQRHSGLPHVFVHLLLFVVEHVELKDVRLQVPVQIPVHGDGVGLEFFEAWVAAVVDGCGQTIGEV